MERPYDYYYDHAPLVIPDRPVALVGLPQAAVLRTARVLSILTGLPLTLLDRQVEHRAGMDLARLLAEPGGERRRRAHEAELLRRALAMKVPPIVALADTTLADPGLRWLVTSRARIVHLRTAPAPLLDELADVVVDVAERHPIVVGRELLERLELDVEDE